MYATGEISYLEIFSGWGYPVHIWSHSTTPRRKKKKSNDVKELHEIERRLFINYFYRGQIDRHGLGFYQRTKAHWPDDKEGIQELFISFDKGYIRRTPTCLPVWHGKTRSFPGMGDSHVEKHSMEPVSLLLVTRDG